VAPPGTVITLSGVIQRWASATSRCRRSCGSNAVPTTPVAPVSEAIRFRLTWHPRGTKNVMENSLAG
jgi:hypothetical protein